MAGSKGDEAKRLAAKGGVQQFQISYRVEPTLIPFGLQEAQNTSTVAFSGDGLDEGLSKAILNRHYPGSSSDSYPTSVSEPVQTSRAPTDDYANLAPLMQLKPQPAE